MGTQSLPFSESFVGNIRIGVANDNTIDTTSGTLTLNSVDGLTLIQDDLYVNGYISAETYISAKGNLQVFGFSTLNGGLNVIGTTTLDSTTIDGTLTVNALLDANAGATIDNIRIGITDDNTIDTSSGNLTIDSTGGTTTINDNLTVTGTSSFRDNVVLEGSSKSLSFRNSVGGSTTLQLNTNGGTISAANGNAVIASTGKLTLNDIIQCTGGSFSGNVNLSSGNLTVSGAVNMSVLLNLGEHCNIVFPFHMQVIQLLLIIVRLNLLQYQKQLQFILLDR